MVESIEISSTEILQRLLGEWALIYGRRIRPEAMEIWIRQFRGVPGKVLCLANERVFQTSEKMPTPATFQKAISAVRAEMGQNSNTPRIIADGTDRNGIDCVFWSDEPTERAYQAKNCPEGRAFLALMKDMHNGKFAPRRRGPPTGRKGRFDLTRSMPGMTKSDTRRSKTILSGLAFGSGRIRSGVSNIF